MVKNLSSPKLSIPFSIEESHQSIRQIRIGKSRPQVYRSLLGKRLQCEIQGYLKARRRSFGRYPLEMSQLSSFDRMVLSEIRRIPYGKTISYGQLAKRIGKPKAARAVGGSLNRNPFPLLIPCHRVISSDGSLGGFSAGKNIKKRLLRLEGILFK